MTTIEIERLSENELVDLANQLKSAKRHADLEVVLRRLMAVGAKPAHYAVPLGWALMSLHRPSDAVGIFDQAIAADAAAWEAFGGRGMALANVGRLADAESALKSAWSGGYRNPQVQIVLADVLNQQKRVEEALACTAELVRLAPTDAAFLFLHGMQLTKLERMQEASEIMKRAVEKESKRARYGSQAAYVIAAAGDFAATIDLILDVLRTTMDDPGLHTLLAHCLEQIHPDKGFAHLRARAAQFPADAVAPYQLSRMLEKDNALDEAAHMAQQSLALKPDSLLAQGQCGRIAVLRGQYAEAAAIFDSLWITVADQVDKKVIPLSAAPPLAARRPVAPQPIIYFAVEIGSRELQTRLIMARLAVAAGLTCVILAHDVLKEAVAHLPPGLIVYKSISSLERKLIGQAAAGGHIFTVIDEEAFGRSGGSAVILKNFDLYNLPACATVFAPGEEYVRGVLDEMPAATSQVLAVGNPRTDLYDPRLRGLFTEEADTIRKELGATLLVCTNFGAWNSAVNPYASVCELALKLAGTAMGTPRGQWLLDISRDSNQAECRNTGAIREAVAALSRAYPTHKIVLRPHPIEDRGVWSRFAEGFENVVIGGAASLAAQMMAADVTIHLPGCGTGLESRLLGRPTVCLNLVGDLKYPRLGLSSRISPTVKSIEALITAIGEAIANPGAYSHLSTEQKQILDDRVKRSDELVCERIVAHLKDLYEAKRREAAGDNPVSTHSDLSAAVDGAVREGHARAQMKSFANIGSAKIKRLDVTADDIRRNLATLGECIGMSADFDVTAPADRIFRISPRG